MRKRNRKPQTLSDAKKLYKYLLWHASGGNMGTEPEIKQENDSFTFAEKRGLLDSIIKIAQLEAKTSEGEEEVSGLELIQRQLNDDRADSSRGNYGGESESRTDDDGDSNEATKDTAADGSGV